MAKGLSDIVADRIFHALGGEQFTGKLGEFYTARELKLVQLLGRKGKILRNVYIPKDNGETSEIDVLYITQKGIFVFESKNYSGWIFGDEKQQKWTMMLPNKEKHSFYNPIKQNKTHIKWLSNFIGEEIPLFSVIVFSERCELKKVTNTDPKVHVIKRDLTYATVRNIWNKQEDKLSEEEVNELYLKLKRLTKVSKKEKEEHIQNIIQKYGEPKEKNVSGQKMEEKKENESSIEQVDICKTEEKICPRCGNKLVLRTARRGEKAGKQFYGCSAFPKCRYILNESVDNIEKKEDMNKSVDNISTEIVLENFKL